ncbi:MAG: tetratricopeptide repeat protein [Betaproteobacteria bacterium]
MRRRGWGPRQRALPTYARVLFLLAAIGAVVFPCWPAKATSGDSGATPPAQAIGGSPAEARVESRVDWSAIVAANKGRLSDDLEGRLYLAVAYANQGMVPEATREFRAIEAAGYEEFGREVIAKAEEALAKDANDIVNLNVVAFAYYAFSDFEKSSECFEKLVSLDPRNIWTRHYFAVSLSRIGKLDKAIEVLKGALALDPSNEYTHLLLGLAYREKGWYILSILEFARAGKAIRELSTLM